MDEVFGVNNYTGMINFATTTGGSIAGNRNYLLWYSKDINKKKSVRIQVCV
jgi:hypothetical protein